MNQKTELYHDPRKALKKKEIFLQKYPTKEWEKIRNEMEEKGLFLVHYLMDQLYLWMGPMETKMQRNKGRMSFKDLGYYFGVNSSSAQKLYQKGKRHLEEDVINRPGRPSTLTEEQIMQVEGYIIKMYNEKTPLRCIDLYEYVTNTFKVEISVSWPQKFRESKQDHFSIVKASPLEDQRCLFTEDLLNQYEIEVQLFLDTIHPSLIGNCDEMGLDQQDTQERWVLVPKLKEKEATFFKQTRENGHITILGTIFSNGWKIPPLCIVTRKTRDSDLEEIDIPGVDLSYIVHTSTGFINNDTWYAYWLKYGVPSINLMRKSLSLEGFTIGMLWDGMYAHDDTRTKDLFIAHNISVFLLPAHSSHLLQPLDQGIFHLVKSDMKRTQSSLPDLTKQSKRIYSVLRSFARYCNPYDCKASFKNSGIIIGGIKDDHPLFFDIWVIYRKKLCPVKVIEIEEPKKKRKLIKLDTFQSEKEKKKKKK
jgi:hypothetical protein